MFLICTTVTCTFRGEPVYVCICNNVTEGDIEDAVRSGARTLDCLAHRLAVSTGCGQCRCVADACLQTALGAIDPVQPRPSLPVLGVAC
jgi:bacterioferritin-associated ferredoxin